MKTLYFCRHAKSSWKDLQCDDIDRELNKRGKRDAPIMGERLFSAGVKPDCIVSSPAVRARKTAAYLAKKLGYPKKSIVVVDQIYAASIDTFFASVRAFDDNIERIIIVGHNPETTIFVNLLANCDIFNVPTCGVVAIQFDIDQWRDVQQGEGKLVFFDFPKKISE